VLTSDLLRTRIQGRRIAPSFIDPSSERLNGRADELLQIFTRAAAESWTRGQLTAGVREVEGTATDHKLIRGLAKVLTDACTFETISPLPPAELRARVFAHAARTGPLALRAGLTGRRTADTVLAEIGAELPPPEGGGAWTPAALQRALYADLKDEQLLTERAGPRDARALLHRYNTALVQALLLRASRVEVSLTRPAPKRVRQLVRYLKFFQLMFRMSREDGQVDLVVDGPQSLLRQSTRYGLQLATFFPAVLLQPGAWSLEAELRWGKRNLRKQLLLSSARGLVSHYRDRGAWRSNIEQWFEERFTAAQTDWVMGPGEPLNLGQQSVLVPDFTFRKDGRVGHLDIVGYWRRGYLRKRLAGTPSNVIVAVSRQLSGETGALPQTLQRRVLGFAKVIPVKKVLERLEMVAQPAR